VTLPRALEAIQSLTVAAEGQRLDFSLRGMLSSLEGFGVVVAAVLAIMSVYSLGIVAERLVTFARARAASRRFAAELPALLGEARLEEAIALAERERRGHLPRVLGVVLRELRESRDGPPGDRSSASDGERAAAVQRVVDRSTLRAVNDLRRGLGALATIGSTAPFVGLLGTVWGIIKAFQRMAVEGGGGLGTVSGAIAEALVNTAFGLLVAVPAVMFFNALTNRVEDMQVDITEAALELVGYVLRQRR